MRVAIYGDSYGDPWRNKLIGWPTVLEQKLGHPIGNYAKSATSLFFSYNECRRTQEQYDKLIFLVTEPNRYHDPFTIDGRDLHITGPNSIRYILADYKKWFRKNPETKFELQRLEHWFYFHRKSNFAYTTHGLMLAQLYRERPDIIFVPCFDSSYRGTEDVDFPHNADVPIYNYTMKIYQGRDTTVWDETNEMSCHFTEEFNVAFADTIHDCIKNNTNTLNLSRMDNVVVDDDTDKYFRKRNK